MGTYHYRCAGVRVASEWPLPELGARQRRPSPAQVRIEEGPVPALAQPAAPGAIAFEVRPGCTRVDVFGVMRMAVHDGAHVRCQRLADHPVAVCAQYLLGAAFGALWHQRGRLPLHAGGVALDGRAWLFAGASGAGKSSVVAALLAVPGSAYLSDDLSVLDVDADGAARVWAGLVRVRLAPAVCAALKLHDAQRLTALDPLGKRALVPPFTRPRGPVPLAGLVLLAGAPAGTAPTLRRVPAAESLAAVLAHTYRRELLADADARGRHLRQCAALAGALPVWQLTRAWNLDALTHDAVTIAGLLRDADAARPAGRIAA